jgi:hypothetical protein
VTVLLPAVVVSVLLQVKVKICMVVGHSQGHLGDVLATLGNVLCMNGVRP